MGRGQKGRLGGKREVLRGGPRFLVCSVELGNSRGSEVGGWCEA